MSLPQDISAIGSEPMDSMVRKGQLNGIQYQGETGFIKVLSQSAGSGQWAVPCKWLKGHVAASHKHLSAAQARPFMHALSCT
jgi:hypothetical protein